MKISKNIIIIVAVLLLLCVTGCSKSASITGKWYVTKIDGDKIDNSDKSLYLDVNEDNTYVLSMGNENDDKYYGTWKSEGGSYYFTDDGAMELVGISSGTATLGNGEMTYIFTSLNHTFTLKK